MAFPNHEHASSSCKPNWLRFTFLVAVAGVGVFAFAWELHNAAKPLAVGLGMFLGGILTFGILKLLMQRFSAGVSLLIYFGILVTAVAGLVMYLLHYVEHHGL